MSDYRCTTCGAITHAALKSPIAPSLDAAVTALDARYTTRWCNWCKRKRESILADNVKEAVANTGLRQRRTAKDPPDQLKGGW